MPLETGQHDPANYRLLNVPVPVATAEERCKAFCEEFYALRTKHGIPDVYVILRLNVIYEDGQEGTVTSRMIAGDEANAEAMTAWAMGYESSQRQERIARILVEAMKGIGQRKPRK